tara:strand:- start:82 stop:756 length:675 start_codon:yes stop_codon:yes gene_type:complete
MKKAVRKIRVGSKGKFRPFVEARKHVLTLGLKNREDFRKWAHSISGDRPLDIPYRPDRSYKDRGWTSWANFLGTHNTNSYANRQKTADKEIDWYIMAPDDLLNFKEACVYFGGFDQRCFDRYMGDATLAYQSPCFLEVGSPLGTCGIKKLRIPTTSEYRIDKCSHTTQTRPYKLHWQRADLDAWADKMQITTGDDLSVIIKELNEAFKFNQEKKLGTFYSDKGA